MPRLLPCFALAAILAAGVSAADPAPTATGGRTAASTLTESSKIAQQLAGRLVRVHHGTLAPVPRDGLAGTKLYAVYFSAHWCPPCRGFTPDLVAAYREIKAAHPEFELIFVSNDRNERAMLEYMRTFAMPWVALRYREADRNRTVEPYRRPAIPNLVFIDGTGRVLSQTYSESGDYLGPRKVLDDIRRHFRL